VAVGPLPGIEEALNGSSGGDGLESGEETAKVESPADKPFIVRRGEVGIKAVVAQWVALNAIEPGITNEEIATRLGITPKTLTQYIYKAAKKGLIQFEDPMAQLEYKIIPSTMDKLQVLIDSGNEKAIIETAKGTIFPVFRESKGVKEAAQTVLALKVEMPSGEQKTFAGSIVGKPKVPSKD